MGGGRGRPPKANASSPLSHLPVSLARKRRGGGSSYDTLVCLFLLAGLAGNLTGALAAEGSSRDWGSHQVSQPRSLHDEGLARRSSLRSQALPFPCTFLSRRLSSPLLPEGGEVGIKEEDPPGSLLGDGLSSEDSPPIEGPGTAGSCGSATTRFPSSHLVVCLHPQLGQWCV